MLNAQTLEDLRREKRALQLRLADLEAIQQRVAAIDLILKGDGVAETPENTGKTAISQAKVPAIGTFRQAVRNILLEATTPLTTDDIVIALELRGVATKGKTPLKTLVSSELWRADKKREGIKRVSHGRYKAIEARSDSA